MIRLSNGEYINPMAIRFASRMEDGSLYVHFHGSSHYLPPDVVEEFDELMRTFGGLTERQESGSVGNDNETRRDFSGPHAWVRQ